MSPDDSEDPLLRKLTQKLEETVSIAARLYLELVRSALQLVTRRRATE